MSTESLPADPSCLLCWERDGRWVSGQTGLALHPKSQWGAAGLLQPFPAKTLLQGQEGLLRRKPCSEAWLIQTGQPPPEDKPASPASWTWKEPAGAMALEKASYGCSPPKPPSSLKSGLKIPTIVYSGHQRLAMESEAGAKHNSSIASLKGTVLSENLRGSWGWITHSLTIWTSMCIRDLAAQALCRSSVMHLCTSGHELLPAELHLTCRTELSINPHTHRLEQKNQETEVVYSKKTSTSTKTC